MSFSEYVTSPLMLLDESIARSNIHDMHMRIRSQGASFRPHFKTHQSLVIGRWFRDEGIDRITVSSLKMAAYFARDGWKDITVAFPANLREHALMNDLAGKVDLGVVTGEEKVIMRLDNYLTNKVKLWIKIDAGYHRAGIAWDQTEKIDTCLKAIAATRHFEMMGFLAHSGHTYKAGSPDEIMDIHTTAKTRLTDLAEYFSPEYGELKISLGDTPSCSIATDFANVDEWRPGNFVFYDLTQQSLGACSYDRIAAIVVCPVVEGHPERSEAVIYGGAVHFSKDRLEMQDGRVVYGKAVSLLPEGWNPEPLDAVITGLSQEHGVVRFSDKNAISGIEPGSLMGFYPVHSCLTANLMRGYMTTRGERLDHMNGCG